MITISHYIWFRHIAEKRNLTGSARALYSYIVGECLWSNRDDVHLTQEMMASALHVSKSTVNSSLKTLQESRLISGSKGFYTVMPPDEDWIERNYWSRITNSVSEQNNSADLQAELEEEFNATIQKELEEERRRAELQAELDSGYFRY